MVDLVGYVTLVLARLRDPLLNSLGEEKGP
jgi:hypothetical protein